MSCCVKVFDILIKWANCMFKNAYAFIKCFLYPLVDCAPCMPFMATRFSAKNNKSVST